jgi:uncharacterized membrane protein YbjE (DUF340 family)
MNGFFDIFLLFACLALGYGLARLRFVPPPRVVDFLLKATLWCLLAFMGYRLGSDDSIGSRLGALGFLALVSAALAVAGSLAALLLAGSLLGGFAPAATGASASRPAARRAARREEGAEARRARRKRAAEEAWLRFRGPVLLLGIAGFGFLAGFFVARPAGLDLDALCASVLKLLLFFIGMQFGQAGTSLKKSLLNPAVLALPLATALGSLLPGLLIAPLFGIGIGRALALQAGFGWYSLSGILITGLGDPSLGTVSFLANMAREGLAFVLIPFLARTRRPWLAIGVGGATAMDVTLPLIEQCAGPEWVPASFASGAILSTLVPILVPLLFRLG